MSKQSLRVIALLLTLLLASVTFQNGLPEFAAASMFASGMYASAFLRRSASELGVNVED